MKTFFFALHLILCEKSDWFRLEQFSIQIFVLLTFSEVPAPPPPFKILRIRYSDLIVWLNVLFSQKILNIIIFKYCIATMLLLSRSIAKYCKFKFLKWNEVPYLHDQVLGKKLSSVVMRHKTPCFCWKILAVFFQRNSNFCDFYRRLYNYRRKYRRR